MSEQPKEENKAMACLRCGGEMFECQANQQTYLQPFKPGLFTARNSNLIAYVCNICGYTEFYATDVAAIKPKQ